MTDLMRFMVESIAIGSLAMLLGRSQFFREARWLIHRRFGERAWELAKCPWCLSVWLAFPLAWYSHLPLTNLGILNTFITWMAMVALAPLAGGIIYICYGFMPPVPTEQEWFMDKALEDYAAKEDK